MNERIRKLLKLASKLANTEDTKDFDRNFDMIVAEKFAELIVEECAAEIAHNENFYWVDAEQAARDLKRHFGVE